MPLMTCIDIVYLWSSRLALCVTQLLCWGQMPRPTLTGLAVSTTRSNLIKVSHFINFIFSGKKNTFILAVRCFYCASMCFLPASCVFFFSSSRLRPRAAQPPRKLKRRWGFRPLCDKIDKESFSTKAKLSYAKLCKAMQSYAKLRGVRLQLCLVGVPCRCLQLHNVPAGLQVLQVSDLQPFPRTRNKMQQAVVCLSVLVLLEKKRRLCKRT